VDDIDTSGMTPQEQFDLGVIPFLDVLQGSSFFIHIKELKAQEIVKGYTDSNFGVDLLVRREEFLVMLMRALYDEATLNQKISYANLNILPGDVPQTNSLAAILAVAYEEGITKGVSADKFGWNVPIRRDEAVVLAMRAFKVVLDDSLPTAPFVDIENLPNEFKKAISKAYFQAVISGQGDLFRPSENLTRGEAAKVIYQFLKNWGV